MRPDDHVPKLDALDGGIELPIDADLEALDEELGAAGASARRSLHGSTQPTRVFSVDLRARLLGTIATPAAAGLLGTDVLLRRGQERGSRIRPELDAPGETWAPTPLEPQLARRTPTVLPRARWSMLAAAMLTLVFVAGALGARFDWLVPSPTADPSASPATQALPTAPPTPGPTAAVVVPVQTEAPAPTARPEATPKPTKKPKPTATPKPAPTKPPVGPMSLAAKACPGGVVLDWTKPSPDVGHYHVLRNKDGDVPPEYPGNGMTEIETATTYGAGKTEGFDATLGGGKSATYRAFAFDADDEVIAYSPSKTAETLDSISLGTLSIVENGPGSITVSWAAASVHSACFSYGKLVASEEDSEPSYLKGSPYLAAIGDKNQTEITLEDLPSGTTVWMKYEVLRMTETGGFQVACSDVIQVTYP